jgi:5-methylcytosine-specific restriction endonuclease McrA
MAPAVGARRRALAFGYTGENFTTEEWLALVEECGGRCLCCGSQEQMTVDHVIPLSRGGSNAISNIQPLCQGCNLDKADTVADYRCDTREGVQMA